MSSKAIGWCITGAGALLEESIRVASNVSRDFDITFFVSRAGEEVLEMYGLMDELCGIVSDSYLDEVFLASDSGFSFPKTGRFMLGRYGALVVSPATSNTVGKMAHGISDTLVTNCFSHATKTGVEVLVVPVELEPAASITPYYISKEFCDRCGRCVDVCPEGAVRCYEIEVLERDVDRENIERVGDMDGVSVFGSPSDLLGRL